MKGRRRRRNDGTRVDEAIKDMASPPAESCKSPISRQLERWEGRGAKGRLLKDAREGNRDRGWVV
jgi:hypothetical protein